MMSKHKTPFPLEISYDIKHKISPSPQSDNVIHAHSFSIMFSQTLTVFERVVTKFMLADVYSVILLSYYK